MMISVGTTAWLGLGGAVVAMGGMVAFCTTVLVGRVRRRCACNRCEARR
jgi:hypothetical protein